MGAANVSYYLGIKVVVEFPEFKMYENYATYLEHCQKIHECIKAQSMVIS